MGKSGKKLAFPAPANGQGFLLQPQKSAANGFLCSALFLSKSEIPKRLPAVQKISFRLGKSSSDFYTDSRVKWHSCRTAPSEPANRLPAKQVSKSVRGTDLRLSHAFQGKRGPHAGVMGNADRKSQRNSKILKPFKAALIQNLKEIKTSFNRFFVLFGILKTEDLHRIFSCFLPALYSNPGKGNAFRQAERNEIV